MDLFNSLPIPTGLLLCFWDVEYIAAQPFCITSKLTEQEAKQLQDFEELKFWERNEALKASLASQARFESVEALEQIKNDGIMESIERVLLKDGFLDDVDKSLEKVGFYNIQPSGRVLPKSTHQTQQNRAMFLSR